MPRIVSSIKKHITTLEFWRAFSFVLKRLESIAKYLTKLPLPFTFILYILDLIRSGLRIVNYFKKTKNKNLGSTCKFLLALFKVSAATVALILLAYGFISLPSVLLASFFAYRILKLIHSAIVLLVSTISYLRIDKQCIEQQWGRAQYLNNMNKHVWMLSMGLLFLLLTYLLNAGISILIWSNPLLLLADAVLVLAFIAAAFYLGYTISKNKRTSDENPLLRKEEITTIKNFFLLFGLGVVALFFIVITPSLGISAIICALIVLCVQDVLLTIYYYFFGVYIPDPEPANLSEEQLNTYPLNYKSNWDYYHTFSPILYLQTQVSEAFQHAADVNKVNKKLLLKVTFLKLLELENKLEKIEKLGTISQFFSSQKKLKIKKEYLLRELAWALNTDDQEALIDLFILTIIDLAENKRTAILANNLCELLDLLDGDSRDYQVATHHLMQKNSLSSLFFLAKQKELTQQSEVIKPNAFYQSFKKISACAALSNTFQKSRNIEEQISLLPSWRSVV